MSSTQERQEALIKEVKALLQEKGKTLDPEVLARLTVAKSGVVEGSASRFATFWRTFRTPAALLLIALFALLFFFLITSEPESPSPPAGMRQGRGSSAARR